MCWKQRGPDVELFSATLLSKHTQAHTDYNAKKKIKTVILPHLLHCNTHDALMKAPMKLISLKMVLLCFLKKK